MQKGAHLSRISEDPSPSPSPHPTVAFRPGEGNTCVTYDLVVPEMRPDSSDPLKFSRRTSGGHTCYFSHREPPPESANLPLDWDEGISLSLRHRLVVRRRLDQMGRAVALFAARPHRDRGPVGRTPASSSTRAATAHLGFSCLEETGATAPSGGGRSKRGSHR